MAQNKSGLWCYSLDNKDYSSGTFESVQAALTAGQKEVKDKITDGEKVDFIYVAKAEQQHNYSFFPDGGDIIEHMADQADTVGGDYVNNYPDVSDEAENELTTELHALLEKWCEKHGVSPSFYQVSEPVIYDAATLKVSKKSA
jgi:hypothetical protein